MYVSFGRGEEVRTTPGATRRVASMPPRLGLPSRPLRISAVRAPRTAEVTRTERIAVAATEPGGRYSYAPGATTLPTSPTLRLPGVSVTRTGLPSFPEASAAATADVGPVVEGPVSEGIGAGEAAAAEEAATTTEEAVAAEEAATGEGPTEEPPRADVAAQEAVVAVLKTEPASNAPWYILMGFAAVIMAYGAYEWSRAKKET